MAGMVQNEDGAILAIKNFVEQARIDLNTENTNVTNHIDSWRPNWQGEGSNSFNTFRQAWNDKFNALLATLDEFEGSLVSTSTTFDSSDSDSSSSFQNLTGSIN